MNIRVENLKGSIILCIFSFVQDGDISKIEEAKTKLIEFAKLYNVTINKMRKSKGDLDMHFANFVMNKDGYANSIEPFYQVLNGLKEKQIIL